MDPTDLGNWSEPEPNSASTTRSETESKRYYNDSINDRILLRALRAVPAGERQRKIDSPVRSRPRIEGSSLKSSWVKRIAMVDK
jgi:hypothetical protein